MIIKPRANQSAGSGLYPSFPSTTAPTSGSEPSGATGRIYKSGRLQTTKLQYPKNDRARFCRAFIGQLYAAVCCRAREEEKLFQVGALSLAMQRLLLAFHHSIVIAIDGTILHRKRGAPKTLSDARNLNRQADEFEQKFHVLITQNQKQRRALLECVEELIEDVKHYARQIEITYGIVQSTAKATRIPNRPINLPAKIEFARLVFIHQQTHGPSSFPKTMQLRAALAAANLSVSDGTVRNWKRQMRTGTFAYFVQPKNGNK